MNLIQRKYYYLFCLTFIFVIPTIIAAYFVWERISFTHLFIFALSITLLGTIWDIWATRHGRKDPVWLWTFNHRDTIGIRVLDLPIEEYLFYLATSVYIVFLWELIGYTLEQQQPGLFFVLPFLAIWSVIFIAVPYISREKNDKFRQ